jgi:hypothetical protein
MNVIEIYENPETAEWEVRGLGECGGLYDDDYFESDVEADAFASEWKDACLKEGIECKIEWIGYKPSWAMQ